MIKRNSQVTKTTEYMKNLFFRENYIHAFTTVSEISHGQHHLLSSCRETEGDF